LEIKTRSATMIFVNSRNEILLFLRDVEPTIRCPNMWDLPGGHQEATETADECIRREMKEELPGLELGQIEVFAVEEFPDRIDTIFWTHADLDSNWVNEVLTEGQRAQWVSASELKGIELAFGFGPTVERFFAMRGEQS
jgi:8-oxo-dGTP diphosphatase